MSKIDLRKRDFSLFQTLSELKKYGISENLCTKANADKWAREIIPKESYYQKKIIQHLKGLSKSGKIDPAAVIWKQQASIYQNNGRPDIGVILRPKGAELGTYVGLEVKRPLLGEVSPTQRATIDRLRAAGAIAEIVVYVYHVDDILRQFGLLWK